MQWNPGPLKNPSTESLGAEKPSGQNPLESSFVLMTTCWDSLLPLRMLKMPSAHIRAKMHRWEGIAVAIAVALAAVTLVLFAPLVPTQEYTACVCPPLASCHCPEIAVGAGAHLVLWSPSWLFSHYGSYLSTHPLGYAVELP